MEIKPLTLVYEVQQELSHPLELEVPVVVHLACLVAGVLLLLHPPLLSLYRISLLLSFDKLPARASFLGEPHQVNPELLKTLAEQLPVTPVVLSEIRTEPLFLRFPYPLFYICTIIIHNDPRPYFGRLLGCSDISLSDWNLYMVFQILTRARW